MKLGIILPTNNPRDLFEKFIPTLDCIKELQNTSIILINFQKYSTAEIEAAKSHFKNQGFDMKYVVERYSAPAPMCWAREICAQLDKICQVYLFVDDNFRFTKGTLQYQRSSGQRYLEVLDYMSKFSNCGGVLCKGSLGGQSKVRYEGKYFIGGDYKIGPVLDGCKEIYSTNRGLFLRNLKEILTVHPETYTLRGSLEESAAAFLRIEKGMFFARQLNNPTIHNCKRFTTYSALPNDIHNSTLWYQEVGKWIRERWGPCCVLREGWPQNPTPWTFGSKRIPKHLVELYVKNGGVLKFSKKYTIDYKIQKYEFQKAYC